VQRGISITLKAYIKKEEKSQINYLIFHLKNLGKEQKINPKQAGEAGGRK